MISTGINLRLTGARIALDASSSALQDLSVIGGQVCLAEQTTNASESLPVVDLSDYLLLPGLINAHDHLEFGLFPRLGCGIYENWRDWADDIYRPEESPLRELLSIPKPVRLWFGGLRNLLCGVTTVAHHNPYIPDVFENRFPVNVVSRYEWAHSLEDSQAAQLFRESSSDCPFLLHFAEGTDAQASAEFERLKKEFTLDNRLVLIHAVGASPEDLHRLAEAKVSLVWCPSSNLFTLNRTLSQETIRSYPYLTLGSDSPLTAVGDFLDELHYAHTRFEISADLLYQMATTRAANILHLHNNCGKLCDGSPADLIAIRCQEKPPSDALVSSTFEDVECVLIKGKIMLLSPDLAGRVPFALRSHLEEVQIGSTRRLLPAPVRDYIQQAEQCGTGICNLMGTRRMRC